MKKLNRTWLLTVVALCSASSAFASDTLARRDFVQQVTVPEGGTAVVYLLGAGLICFGAMFLRSKVAKPLQS
jgi:hypothetical protein